VVRLLSEDEFTAELVDPIFSEVAEPVPTATLNVPHVVDSWRSLMKNGLAVTWAGVVGGMVGGLLGALFITEFFTGRPMAMEQFWFVRQEQRRSGIGMRLFREFEAEAKRRGAETVWAGTNRFHDPGRLGRFYERKGFVQWGTVYRKMA